MIPTATPTETRHSIVQVAMNVLEQEGLEALSLSRVARRAGLEAPLPFEDERALRSELASIAFTVLSQSLADAELESSAHHHGPHERLLGAGRAYVRTAIARPALFALIRDPAALDFSLGSLRTEGDNASRALLGLVDDLQRAGFESGRDPADLAATIWACVHRVTMRWADASLSGALAEETFNEALDLELTLLLEHGAGDLDQPRARPCPATNPFAEIHPEGPR